MKSRDRIETSGAPAARPSCGSIRRPARTALLFVPLLGLATSAAPGAAQADLVVTFDPVPNAPFVLGQQAELGVTVLNRGNRATPTGECIKVHFRATSGSFVLLTANGFLGNFCGDNLDRGDEGRRCRISGTQATGWCKLSAIGAGGRNGIRLVVRPVTLGGHAHVLTVDPDNRIRESSDRNNVMAIPVTIRGPYDEQESAGASLRTRSGR